MRRVKRIGLFGGTFNPIHFGHLNLALELKEKGDLDGVWLIPAHHSPLRLHTHPLSPVHRSAMIQLALEDIPDFSLYEGELKRPPPSYTIETLREIFATYQDIQFYFICGEDVFLTFQQWKDPLEIVRQISFMIGSRPQSELLPLLSALDYHPEIEAAIYQGLVPIRQMEISATEIRERLKRGLYCGHLLPGKVLDYIYENQLYSTAYAKSL